MATTTTVLASKSYPAATHTWSGSLPAGATAATVEMAVPSQPGSTVVASATLSDSPDGVVWQERGAVVGGGPGGCDSTVAYVGLAPHLQVVTTITGGSLTVGLTATFA